MGCTRMGLKRRFRKCCFPAVLEVRVALPLSEYGFAYGLKTETRQFSMNFLVSPTEKERNMPVFEYRSSTVSAVSKYGLGWS